MNAGGPQPGGESRRISARHQLVGRQVSLNVAAREVHSPGVASGHVVQGVESSHREIEGQPGGGSVGAVTEKWVAAPLTLMEPEMPLIEALTVSVAVMVCSPAVFNVAEKVPAPLVTVELAGENTAWVSLLVTRTVPA